MTRIRTHSLFVGALLAALGCAGEPPKPPPAAPEPALEAPAQVEVVRGTTRPIPSHVDAALFRELRAIAKLCRIDDRASSVACTERSARERLDDAFTAAARSRAKTLETALHAFERAEPGLVTVAAELLDAQLSAVPASNAAAPSAETVRQLIATLGRLAPAQAVDATPAIVHAAIERGLEAELYRAVEAHPSPRVAVTAYRHLLDVGAGRTLIKVQELVKSSRLEVAMAALEAVRRMPAPSAAQRAALCEWARSWERDARPLVAREAGSIVVACSEPHVEVVSDAGPARKVVTAQPAVAEVPHNGGTMRTKPWDGPRP